MHREAGCSLGPISRCTSVEAASKQSGTDDVATGDDLYKEKDSPIMHRYQGTAVGSIFLVIYGESLNSIYCPSAVRAHQGMPSSQLGCSGQAEDRCGAALGSSCPNLSAQAFYPGCDSNPPGGTHKTERAELSPEGTRKAACCQPGDVRGDHGSLTFALSFQDEKYSVTVYKSVLQNGSRCWEHLAGLHSHYKPIRSILFGVQLDSNEPRLLSLGEDRQLVGRCESPKGQWSFVVKVGGWTKALRETQSLVLQLLTLSPPAPSQGVVSQPGLRADLPRVQG